MKFSFLLLFSIVFVSLSAQESQAQDDNIHASIQVAQFDNDNRLIRPANIDEWIFLGANVGHGYPGEDAKEFNQTNPGRIQIIQMEPNAYHFFKENKYFINGTMLSLSFYNPLSNPSPDIDGLAQGELSTFEIHLIDRDQYEDTRAFFLYESGDEAASMVSSGNRCVACHQAEGDYDGTFSQFYPVIRKILAD